jgi:dTDP-4-dehydrorhamnose 3,5-epimerase
MEIDGVTFHSLRQFENPLGNVWHGMKKSDTGFAGFGEAYFSWLHPKAVKGWKRHSEMTLNLVVPVGQVRFVFFDDRDGSPTRGRFHEEIFGEGRYGRLTVVPGLWFAFQGVSDRDTLILNLASVEHSPNEAQTKQLSEIPFQW